MKEVHTEKLWSFEIGNSKMNKRIYLDYCGFSTERQGSQNLKNVSFYRPPLTNAQCVIETENLFGFSYFLEL